MLELAQTTTFVGVGGGAGSLRKRRNIYDNLPRLACNNGGFAMYLRNIAMIRKTLIAALCGIALAPLGAHAQWLDTLKNAAAQAAVGAVQKVVDKPAAEPQERSSAAAQATRNADAPAAPGAQRAAETSAAPGCRKLKGNVLPPVGERPADFKPEVLWPEETQCSYYKFADLKFDAAREMKKKFENASKVPCSDCEGGYSFDAWAHFSMGKGGISKEKFEAMLVALKPGQHIDWKGAKFQGQVLLSGEQPVAGFPCKQFHWTLKDKSGNQVAEREGMYCEYKEEYSTTAKWHEIL